MSKVSSIGGQALMEGVMMRGPSSMAMSVRDDNGFIQTESERLKPRKWYNKVPIIRGVAAFISSLYTGVSTLTRSAKVLGGEDEQLSDGAMTFAVILGLVLAVALFIVVPEVLARLFNNFVYDNVLVKSLIAGVLRIVIFILYLLIVSKMKDIKRTFMYHGAEHKTIFCYEHGLPLTVENVRKQRRFHPRCGTSFLILMLIIGFLIGIFIPFNNAIIRTLLRIALLPLTVGIGYELIKFAGRHDNLLTKIISAPGVWLQHITTKEPDDGMIECAIAAMNEVIPEDKEKDNW